MGDEMDELDKELERMAAVEAGKVAAKSAWHGIKSAVGGLADDVLGYAERELAAAEAARGRGTITHAPGEALDPSEASERALETIRRAAPTAAAESAMTRRRAREQRARERLEALKQAHLEGRPLRPPAEPEEEEIVEAATVAPPADILSAPRHLDGPEEHPTQPEDLAPAKRTL